MKRSWLLVLGLAAVAQAAVDPWQVAQTNSRQSRRAVEFCRRYAQGWLQHADPVSGLLPRCVDRADQRFWNARDCAADNYPFLTLIGEMTGDYTLRLISRRILDQEIKLTCRLDSLPDDFDFATQQFKSATANMADVIYGASEYCKDGLIPITEWVGPGPWSKRMADLLGDIWKHAAIDSPVGKVPTNIVEIDGDLLQAMSRMYWMTGDDRYKDWTFKLADLYFFHKRLLDQPTMSLRDHGCEIIGGLSEAYVIAHEKDRARYEKYKPEMYAILDFIAEHGLDERGMMYIALDAKSGKPTTKGISDGFGYVFDAFLTVAAVDDEARFRDPVINTLTGIDSIPLEQEEGIAGRAVADQMADSLEGAINLLNRYPIESALNWVDRQMAVLFGKQRPDGIIEAWYGDGNSARTALMYALYKTQGITPVPWRDDLQVGASRDRDGIVRVFINCEYPWAGRLSFDRPRHREHLRLPLDYARINQFPEWSSVQADQQYQVTLDGEPPKTVSGRDLLAWPLTVAPGKPVLLTVKPTKQAPSSRSAVMAASQPAISTAPAATLRSMQYSYRGKPEAIAWQDDVRRRLFAAMSTSDLLKMTIPLSPRPLSVQVADGYSVREVEFNSTRTRRIKAIVTVPSTVATMPAGLDDWLGNPRLRSKAGHPTYPAVVCIHGHGGDRRMVYDVKSIYKGFAARLAAEGYVTIAIDVGQHEVFEPGRTLMGERLWDLMRCVDLLRIVPEVDESRIGCCGLSLGGEMAMWLGAMDPRVHGTVSCGFLTQMDQMEQNHCPCWKFNGLRELVDFADIYSLIAPRPLQCQNGLAEPPNQFPVSLALRAMGEIKQIYMDLGVRGYVGLAVHRGGHEVDVEAMMAFFKAHLGRG